MDKISDVLSPISDMHTLVAIIEQETVSDMYTSETRALYQNV